MSFLIGRSVPKAPKQALIFMQSLKEKPWLSLETEVVKELSLPRGMIGPEERSCFHYLSRFCTEGRGAIIDAGAFIGASAFSFASGLARNEKANHRRQVIHSFDQFVVNEDYVGKFITDSLREIKSGESFFDIYQWQTGKYNQYIQAHNGDLLQCPWEGGRIDILFVDISKMIRLNSYVVEQFFPHLVPGESYVIQQDFYHCWHPYIHITMEFLSESFEILDGLIPYHTRLYKLVAPLDTVKIRRLIDYDFGPEERLQLLDRFIERESGIMRGMGFTVKLCQLWMDNNIDMYKIEREKFGSEFDLTVEDQVYAYQARMLDDLVARNEPCRFY